MHHKSKRPRTSRTHHPVSRGYSLRNYPRWWDIVFHTRPKRRRDAKRLRQVIHGADPDGIAWELASRRPHQFYW